VLAERNRGRPPRDLRLLNPGEHTPIAAREDLVLRVGDAAAFGFTINGGCGTSPGQRRSAGDDPSHASELCGFSTGKSHRR